jgi:hypothetical protein
VLSDILQRLDKVRRQGDRYRSVCPVHDGNNPTALSLREEDGKVLIHCYACLATGPEVVEALGLSVNVLFRDENRNVTDIPRKVLEKAQEDKWFIELYENEKEKGGKIAYTDYKRYRLAKERVKLIA